MTLASAAGQRFLYGHLDMRDVALELGLLAEITPE